MSSTTLNSPVPRRRYQTIDVAKAFAIILVVIGHFTDPHMPEAYDVIREVIYMFHMPLFVFASGFLYEAVRRPVSYGSFVARKFHRLMVPYFITSVIIILLKISMSGILPMDNPVSLFSLIEMFYLPSAGYFLWFVWALWWMQIIMPLFNRIRSRILLFILSLILYFCADYLPELFCFRQFGLNLVYFVTGVLFCDYMRQSGTERFGIAWQVVSICLFSVLAVCQLVVDTPDVAKPLIFLITGISGIAMSFSLASFFRTSASGPLLKVAYSVASASYIIYLFHTTFEGFAKGVLSYLHFFSMSPHMLTAWTGAVIVIVCGTVVPWWLAERVFIRWHVTRFIFGLRVPSISNTSEN